MASIRRRGERWHVQIRRKDHPPICKAFAHRKDADSWARDVERRLDRGDDIAAPVAPVTVAELIAKYAATEARRRHRGHPAPGDGERLREVASATDLRELGLLRRVMVKELSRRSLFDNAEFCRPRPRGEAMRPWTPLTQLVMSRTPRAMEQFAEQGALLAWLDERASQLEQHGADAFDWCWQGLAYDAHDVGGHTRLRGRRGAGAARHPRADARARAGRGPGQPALCRTGTGRPHPALPLP